MNEWKEEWMNLRINKMVREFRTIIRMKGCLNKDQMIDF